MAVSTRFEHLHLSAEWPIKIEVDMADAVPAVRPKRSALRSKRKLRIALARRAYDVGEVRLAGSDLAGCDHVVSTRHGLFAVNREERRLIAYGLFFGLTISGSDILAFEACDELRLPTCRGRIVRLRRSGSRIDGGDVIADGLSNGCHQIDLIGDRLFVTDTYRQRIVEISPDGTRREYDPVPCANRGDWSKGYAHLNSLIASGNERLVLLHNGGDDTGRTSEVAVLDARWRLRRRHQLAGLGCHSFAILENGSLLACGSLAGELIGSDGFRIKVTDQMTRGLSVGRDSVVVGASSFGERGQRDELIGAVHFLDREYQPVAVLPMPAPPMDIRRLDGVDRSLSNHVIEVGGAVRWPR